MYYRCLYRARAVPVSAETSKYEAPTAAATPRDSASGTARADFRSALFASTVSTMSGPTWKTPQACRMCHQQVRMLA